MEPCTICIVRSSMMDAYDIFVAGSRTEQPSTSAASAASDEVLWEYKWKEDDSELHGPFNSSQMLEWQEGGFFKDGALVRKVNAKDGKFYSSRRIDFDLYT